MAWTDEAKVAVLTLDPAKGADYSGVTLTINGRTYPVEDFSAGADSEPTGIRCFECGAQEVRQKVGPVATTLLHADDCPLVRSRRIAPVLGLPFDVTKPRENQCRSFEGGSCGLRCVLDVGHTGEHRGYTGARWQSGPKAYYGTIQIDGLGSVACTEREESSGETRVALALRYDCLATYEQAIAAAFNGRLPCRLVLRGKERSVLIRGKSAPELRADLCEIVLSLIDAPARAKPPARERFCPEHKPGSRAWYEAVSCGKVTSDPRTGQVRVELPADMAHEQAERIIDYLHDNAPLCVALEVVRAGHVDAVDMTIGYAPEKPATIPVDVRCDECGATSADPKTFAHKLGCVTDRRCREAPLVSLVNSPPAWADPVAWRTAVLAAHEKIGAPERCKDLREPARGWRAFLSQVIAEFIGARERHDDRDAARSAIEVVRDDERGPWIYGIVFDTCAAYARALLPAAKVAPERRDRGPVLVVDDGRWDE